CNKYGIQVYSSIAGGSNYNIVANNTIFASYGGIVIGGADIGRGRPTVDHNTIINNIVYEITSYGFHVSGIFGSHNITSNNLTFKDGANYSRTYTNHTNDIVSDPLFVNYTGSAIGDYHLQPGSPAIGAGAAELAPTLDFEFNLRRQMPSLGAYESQTQSTNKM
ncbi:MAG: hypothetical protein JRN15_09225, partial [Nitrososphaerota archaeon]|nr:hypothetical protein [Nitrososphaerota archaeon]